MDTCEVVSLCVPAQCTDERSRWFLVTCYLPVCTHLPPIIPPHIFLEKNRIIWTWTCSYSGSDASISFEFRGFKKKTNKSCRLVTLWSRGLMFALLKKRIDLQAGRTTRTISTQEWTGSSNTSRKRLGETSRDRTENKGSCAEEKTKKNNGRLSWCYEHMG